MARSFMLAFPLAGLMLLLLIGVLWRGWFQYRRYGNLGIVLFQSPGSLRHTRDIIFCLLFLAAIVQAAVFFVSPESLARFEAVSLPDWTVWLGGVLIFVGLAVTVAAQLGMGASWRIGIDSEARPGLVTSGLYQFCRNPIYLGMIVILIGITLMLATWISLALAVGVVWSIRTQVMEEELYLERTYGSAYRNYAARVGRFWPRVGRLNRALSLG